MIGQQEINRFSSLALAESYSISGFCAEEGIGIYNEKRLHRILKRMIRDNENCFEIKVGKYTADVLCDDHIYEIQCASFAPLRDKIPYYLSKTEYAVTVVHPIVVKRKIIRAERETGEVKYVRTSPKKGKMEDILPKMYYLRNSIEDPRFSLVAVLVEVEEYRYSEAVRRRRTGKYDSEVFPTALAGICEFSKSSDYSRFIPDELLKTEFTASDYGKYTSLRGKDLYSALNFLAEIGVICKRTEGRRSFFSYLS